MSFSTGSRVNQTGWPEPHRHNSGFNIINPRFLRQQAPQPVSDQHPQQQQLSRHSSRLRTTSAPRPVDNEDGRTQSILTTNRENQNQHGAKTSRTPSVTSHYVQHSPPSASQLQRMNSNSASYSFQYTQNKHMSGNDIVMKAMRSREGSRHSSVLTVPYDVPLPQPPARVTFPISRRGSRSSYSRMQSQANLVPDAEKYNGSNPITGAYINIGNSGGGGGEQPGPNPTATIRTTQQRSDDKTTPPTVQEDNSVLGDIQGLRVPASMNKSSFSVGSPPRTGNPNGPAANASTGNSFKKNGIRTHFKTSIFTEALPAVEVATTGARSFRNTSDNDPNADSQKVSVNNSSTRSGSFNNNNSVVVVVPPASNNTSNTTATSVSQFNSHGYSTSNTNDNIKLNQDGKLCSAGDSTDVAHCDSIIKPFMNGNNGARHGSAVVEFINPSVSTRSTGNNSREVSSAPTQTQGSAVMSILSSFLSPFSNHTTDVVNHGDAVSSEQHDIGEPVLHSEENVRPLASMRRISGEQNSSWRISGSLLGFQRRLSRISNSFNNNSNHSSNNNNNNSSSNKACEENPPAPIVLKERISISMTDQSVDSGPPSAIPLSRDPSSTPPTGLDMPSNSSAVSTSSMQDVLAGVAAQLELADSMRRVMSPRAFTSVFASQQPDSGTVSSPSDGTDSCVGVESKSPPLLPDANAAVLPTAEDEEECLDGSIKRSTLKFDVSDAEGVPSSSQRPQSTPAEMMSGAASTSPLIGILLKPGGSRRSLTETSSPLVLPVSPPTTSFLFSRRQSNSLGSSSGGIANRKVPGGCRIGRGGALLDHSIVRALNRGDFGDHYQLEFASGSSLAGTNSRQQLANEDGTHRYGNNNAINNDNNNNINNNTNNNNNNNINNINNINLFPVAGRGLAGHKFSSAFSRVSTNSLGAVEYSARPSIQYEPLQVDFMDEFGTLASGGTNALLLSAACNSAHSLFCSTSDAHAIVPAEGNNTVVRNGDDHVNVSKEYHDGSVDSSSTGEGDQVMGRI